MRRRTPAVNIKVVGVGGGGQNAVTRMYRNRIPGVEYIATNTDAQALAHAEAHMRLRVGDNIAKGMGVGGVPELGRACFEESADAVRESLAGTDLAFVAAGMGGGTGTGGAPIVARIAKQDLGCLTVGVVTKPFPFEGHQRQQQALRGLNWLAQEVDTLIVIPNERLLLVSDPSMSMAAAFRMADEVLRQAMQSITELLLLPGEINLDFADLRAVMRDAGPAWMAIGKGNGIDRADAAILAALESPLLEVKIDGAAGVLLNITGGSDLMMAEVSKISETVKRQVHPDAEIIFGTTQDLRMENELKITIIATGFEYADQIEHYERQRQAREAELSAARKQRIRETDSEDVEVPEFLRRRRPAPESDPDADRPEATESVADEPDQPADVVDAADDQAADDHLDQDRGAESGRAEPEPSAPPPESEADAATPAADADADADDDLPAANEEPVAADAVADSDASADLPVADEPPASETNGAPRKSRSTRQTTRRQTTRRTKRADAKTNGASDEPADTKSDAADDAKSTAAETEAPAGKASNGARAAKSAKAPASRRRSGKRPAANKRPRTRNT